MNNFDQNKRLTILEYNELILNNFYPNNNSISLEFSILIPLPLIKNAFNQLLLLYPELTRKITLENALVENTLSPDLNSGESWLRIINVENDYFRKELYKQLEFENNTYLDLEKGQNYRLVKMDDQCNLSTTIILTFSHVIVDGVSLTILANVFCNILSKLAQKKTFEYKRHATNNIDARLFQYKLLGNHKPDDIKSDFFIIAQDNKIKALEIELNDQQMKALTQKYSFNRIVSASVIVSSLGLFNEVQVRRLVSLRDRISGVGALNVGEYHASWVQNINLTIAHSIYDYYAQLYDFNEYKSEIIDEYIDQLQHSFISSESIYDYYLNHKQITIPTISVSTFGIVPSIPMLNAISGVTSNRAFPKDSFLLMAGIYNKKLHMVLQYIDSVTPDKTATQFITNLKYTIETFLKDDIVNV